jgi:hypothetical protein
MLRALRLAKRALRMVGVSVPVTSAVIVAAAGVARCPGCLAACRSSRVARA